MKNQNCPTVIVYNIKKLNQSCYLSKRLYMYIVKQIKIGNDYKDINCRRGFRKYDFPVMYLLYFFI